MLYAINLVHGGFVAGALAFLLWSLPGAIGACALAVGVSNINDTLPGLAYAFLTGLNGATVGIIALAAVQLAGKTITDKLTLLLLFLGGTAGILYQALWYYPVLIFFGGGVAVVWDYGWLQRGLKAVIFGRQRRRESERIEEQDAVRLEGNASLNTTSSNKTLRRPISTSEEGNSSSQDQADGDHPTPRSRFRLLSWKTGVIITIAFFMTFIAVMVIRGTLPLPPRGFSLFANLYLAGTIIFGGGPVVIPLLREYVVEEGWVSPRDFLLGLAIIQAFPGPNFNFAVYLGALAVVGHLSPVLGAFIGFIAIFAPGLILHTGIMGLWNILRRYRWAASGIRGVNSVAVGLIYTAVYRLWQIGYLGPGFSGGRPLAEEAWWVVVTVTSFVGGRWFGVPAPLAIVVGGIMGMIWFGVVGG